MNQPRDELLERYADAVAQDPRRPSERVHNAVRAHAQMLRDQAAEVARASGSKPATQAANQPQWTLSLVASLAVVGLAGLLYLQIDRGAPEDREVALGVPARSDAAPAAAPAAAPTAPAAIAVAPAKTVVANAADRKTSPGRPAAPIQDAPQALPGVAAPKPDSAHPPSEADAARRPDANRSAQAMAGAGATQDAKREASAEASLRATPAAKSAAAPAAPPPPAPAAVTANAGAVAPATAARARPAQINVAVLQFLEAARTGQVDAMERLLSQGISINASDDSGNTALMLAVTHQQAPTVRKLLAIGADPSLVNHEGLSALQLAKRLELVDMVKLLQTPR